MPLSSAVLAPRENATHFDVILRCILKAPLNAFDGYIIPEQWDVYQSGPATDDETLYVMRADKTVTVLAFGADDAINQAKQEADLQLDSFDIECSLWVDTDQEESVQFPTRPVVASA